VWGKAVAVSRYQNSAIFLAVLGSSAIPCAQWLRLGSANGSIRLTQTKVCSFFFDGPFDPKQRQWTLLSTDAALPMIRMA
jgi:hypothetical protein